MKKEFKKEKPEELTNLRCYNCNHEYKQKLSIDESFVELDCPECYKNTVEINMGKK